MTLISFTQNLQTAWGHVVHRVARMVRALLGDLRRRGQPGDVLRLAVLSDAFIRYGSAQAVALSRAGAEVTFYYVDRLGEFDGDVRDRQVYLDRVADAGIDIVPLPQRNLLRLPRHVVSLHRDLAKRAIDAAVVHQHIDSRYATLGFRLPVALFIHDPKPHSGDYASTYPLPARVVARVAQLTADCILLHSERLRSQLPAILRRVPVGFVPHGSEVADSPREISSPPRVVLIGRLMQYKGVDVALDAFERVRSERPDCTLVLAGKGRMGRALRASCPPGVELRDRYLPESEMLGLLDEARLVLLPYLDATQSGVGLQAIARGVPCIVSNVGALPDLVPPGSDWLVPPRDADALASAILRALDHDIAVREALLRFASERFAWEVVARVLVDELRRLRVVVD